MGWRCHRCARTFKTIQERTRHLEQDHPEHQWPCNRCECNFGSQRERHLHNVRMHPTKDVMCRWCTYVVNFDGAQEKLRGHCRSRHLGVSAGKGEPLWREKPHQHMAEHQPFPLGARWKMYIDPCYLPLKTY